MTGEPKSNDAEGHCRNSLNDRELENAVDKQTRRRLRATKEGKRSPWFGLGMFGLVGWSIALPTVAGAMLGNWIDTNYPGRVSWRLTLLVLGVVVGFSMACYWMQKEFKQ